MKSQTDCIERYFTESPVACGDSFSIVCDTGLHNATGRVFSSQGTMQIVCTAGSLRGMVDERVFLLPAPAVLLILPKVLLRIDEVSDNFRCTYTYQSRTFSETQNVGEEYKQYQHIFSAPVYHFSQEEATSVAMYNRLMYLTVCSRTGQCCEEILRHLSIANHLTNASFLHEKIEDKQSSRSGELMLRFTTLLEQNYTRQHTLAFYADKLCLSKKYLSRCICHTSGHPAAWWIDYYIMRDAENYLLHSQLSISAISDLLGFPDQSAFGKYFKRHRGSSPHQWRHRIRIQTEPTT